MCIYSRAELVMDMGHDTKHNELSITYYALRITHDVLRVTYYVLYVLRRITYYIVSRIMYYLLHITYYAVRIMYHVLRIMYLDYCNQYNKCFHSFIVLNCITICSIIIILQLQQHSEQMCFFAP